MVSPPCTSLIHLESLHGSTDRKQHTKGSLSEGEYPPCKHASVIGLRGMMYHSSRLSNYLLVNRGKKRTLNEFDLFCSFVAPQH